MHSRTYAALTDTGRVREHNEDSLYVDAEAGIYIVSDGMGGHVAGELASKIVVETLPRLIRERDILGDLDSGGSSTALKSALTWLSEHLVEESRGEPSTHGLGATVVVALVEDDRSLIGHMGDSRAYLYRGKELTQLIKDQTLIQAMLDVGEITVKEAKTHSARGQLTCYIGMEGETFPEAKLVDLEIDDSLLLCSDGLTDMLSDEHIAKIIEECRDPDEACRCLIERANDAGGKDNVSAVIVKLGGSEP